MFNSTEQQAKTYKALSLEIDGEKRIDELNTSFSENDNRSQLQYRVISNKVPLKKSNSTIIYVASYRCPAIDFFFSHRLNYLCNKLSANIILSTELKQKYTILSSTFSPYSEYHYDDYKAL